MFKYIYVCNPLDFWEKHQYRTLMEIWDVYEDCQGYNAGQLLTNKCNVAIDLFKNYFNEDFRGDDDVMFTSVMQDGCLEDVLIAKADNNGTTYLFTNAEFKFDGIMDIYTLEQNYILNKGE